MNQNLAKCVPVRVEDREYQELRKQVLRRDSWRCQFCGSMTNLEVHHQQFRSHSGPDHEDNLITLCNGCHSAKHGTNSPTRTRSCPLNCSRRRLNVSRSWLY